MKVFKTGFDVWLTGRSCNMPMDQIWIVSILENKPYRDVKKLWRLFGTKYRSVGVQIFSHPHITFQGGKTTNTRQLKKDFQEIASEAKPFEIRVNGPRHFGKRVIYLEVEKTRELIETNELIDRFLRARCHGLFEDYAPGNWIPHVTLAMDDLTRSNFEKAWAQLKDSRIRFRQELHNLCIVKRYPNERVKIAGRYKL